MLTEHHNFVDEHPEFKEQIHNLKADNAHFNKLFDQYNETNKEILHVEKGAESASDERLEGLKKQCLKLNDDMVNIITKAA